MEIGSREVTKQEIDLVQEMFNLGVEAGSYRYDVGLSWTDFKKNELLSRVDKDLAMTDLLKEMFERGRLMGERRRQKRRKPEKEGLTPDVTVLELLDEDYLPPPPPDT